MMTVRSAGLRSTSLRKWPAALFSGLLLGCSPVFAAEPISAADVGFVKTLELLDITFKISATKQGSLNQLSILATGSGLTDSNINTEIDGSLTDAEVADLNKDGSPEIYVFVTSAGSGSYASLVAYAANDNKSLSQIYLPPLTDTPELAKGYMGHDQLSLGDDVLLRRFPLYRDGDSNAAPSGGTRQIQYQLVQGEAGWRLEVSKVADN